MIYCEIAFTILLLAIAVVDVRSRLIPIWLLLFAGVVALIYLVFTGTLVSGLIGGLIGLAVFGILYFLAPSKVGVGDVVLAGLIGLMVGFPWVSVALLLALLTGSMTIIVLVILKRVKTTGSIPYAPFLCSGAIISLWAGDWIISGYLGLF